MQALVDDGYVMCLDLCAVDYLTHPGRALPDGVDARALRGRGRTSSTSRPQRALRVRVQVPADDPTLPSLFDLWPGTEAMEREAFDMFGIRFDGPPRPDPHPDARGLDRPPAAQGLRRRAASPCSSRAHGPADE